MDLPFKMQITTQMEQWRCDTFFSKEAETIEWIKSFDSHDIFLDVGANIGLYSLYAASLFPTMQIWAFEPMIANYQALIKNKELNNFYDLNVYQMAIGNRNGSCRLAIPKLEAGETGAQIVSKGGQDIVQMLKIDSLWFKPSHIKIDIDGQEMKVVRGMKKTLRNKALKSVLIEIDHEQDEIIPIFIKAGFTTNNRFNKMENHSRVRRAREGIKAENIVFTR